MPQATATTEMKHTPGPWTLRPSTLAIVGPVVRDSYGSDTYCIGYASDVHPHRQANARLMTAAPEMLDALRKCGEVALELFQEPANRASANAMLTAINSAIRLAETGAR